MNIGPWQIVLILVIVLVVFGAGRLPTVMGDLARGMRAFKKNLLDDDLNPDKPRVTARKKTSTKKSARSKKSS